MNENNQDHIRIGKQSALIPSRTHTFANNTPFYAAVPSPFQQYYMRHVRHWFQWYDGFVDYFHNHQSGIYSTRLAYALLHKLAKLTVGKHLLFDDEGTPDTHFIKVNGRELNSLEFTEYWAKDNDLSQKVKQAKEWAYAGGDSLLKLDNYNKKLNVSVVRKDNYFIDCDFGGELSAASILIYTYTNMIQKSGSEYTELFYLFEERNYDSNNNPQWRLTIKKGTGHGVSYKNVDFHSGDVDFRDLPKHIREKLVKEYPNTQFGEWVKLPFKDLGLYLVKATNKVSFMPSLPFGESLLSGILHLLQGFDFEYSAWLTDVYLARGKVLMPQHMQQPNVLEDFNEHYSGMDTFLLQRIPYVSPESQAPLPIQFELRSEEWKNTRNNILQQIATNLGISERTVATYVVPASEKPTAYEISSDEDATAAFVEDKREMLQRVLDNMIETVLDFYDFGNEKVYVKFSKVGLTNINNLINQVSILKQNGIVDLKTALEMVFYDKTAKQIDNMYNAIRKENEEKMENKEKNEEMTNPVDKAIQESRNQSTMSQTTESDKFK